MSFISLDDLITAHKRRYATRRFDRSRAIPENVWNTLAECLRLTPSAYNLQPWKFVIVTDDELKKKLRTHSFNQEQIEDCSHLVVICARETIDHEWLDRLMNLTAEKTAVTKKSLDPHLNVIESDLFGFRKEELREISIRQCYIAVGNLVGAAALLGLDSCPIEGFIPSKYGEVLGIAGTGWQACLVCAIGYRHSEDGPTEQKVRFPLSDIIDMRDN